jgi:steroid delta-isomerase-like uncharacterized protein
MGGEGFTASQRPVGEMLTPKQVLTEWAAALNRRDAAAAAALYHDDAMNMQVAWGEPVRGQQAMLDSLHAILRAFPDSTTQVEHLFEEGEWAIMEWSFSGTFRGAFAGHAPTGRRFMLRGCECFHVTDGKIRFQRGYWDRATWFRQLGLPID